MKIGHATLVIQRIGFVDIIDIVDWVVVDIQNIFVPSHLRVIELCRDGTDTIEILLRGITHGQAASDTAHHLLRHVGNKRHPVHHITAIDTNGQVVTIDAHLCAQCCW